MTLPVYYHTMIDLSDLHKIHVFDVPNPDGTIHYEEVKYTGVIFASRPEALSTIVDECEGLRLEDYLHDYLLNFTRGLELIFNSERAELEKQRLLDLKVNEDWLNPENWINVRVSYLPFEHYLYIKEGWMI